MTRRTRREKINAQKKEKVDKEVIKGVRQEKNDLKYFKADLTKSLWLTMLAIGVEVALWYFLNKK